jgi:hypothetical protein
VVRDSVVLDPDIGFIKTIRKPADVRFPVADEEVKVVRTIALRHICRIGRRLRSKRNSERHADRHDKKEWRRGPEFSDIHRNFVPPRLL